MPEILNYTPFPASTFAVLDKHAHQFDVVVISATFEARPGQPVRLADVQQTVRDADEFYGAPGLSSVRYEGEIASEKPLVDVLVNGSAVAPGGRKTETVIVSLSVGDVRKELQVSGDRYWRSGVLGMTASSPEPFVVMPIIYERAFGGTETRSPDPAKHAVDPRNPVGVGFRGARSLDPRIATEIPNVEYPGQRLASPKDRPQPAGLGVVSRNTVPRIAFAGTYDQAWMTNQRPLLPSDFDPRHYQAAPGDQQSATIRGGEQVEIRNMTPEGVWRFTLPTLDIPLRLWPRDRSDRIDAPSLRTDAVMFEPDLHRVTLIARARVLVLRNQAPLEEIILGHISDAWWRARMRGKVFVDHRGKGGRIDSVEAFQL